MIFFSVLKRKNCEFCPEVSQAARCALYFRNKFPTMCDTQMSESNDQTRSGMKQKKKG
ncbi:DUF6783 domain-containing protein [Robinsoniella peoriensis]|uniref:DUF6783 domain-containing protein n=1 Tax=Robinsoniella peoriensis TaxID=180332 RepID=UPI003A7F3547